MNGNTLWVGVSAGCALLLMVAMCAGGGAAYFYFSNDVTSAPSQVTPSSASP